MAKPLVVEGLVKVYGGKVRAVDGISFEVEEGEIFGLIGPNGAGKTTTLRIVATLLLPTSGRVLVYGHDVVRDADVVRRLISYLPEEAGAYRNLTGWEYLEFMASFYASTREEARRMAAEAAEISGLGDRLYDKVKTYSKGMRRRLLIARALMVKPRLAVLDEPTSGLDVVHAYHVRRVVKDYVRSTGAAVLLSSHNMLEVQTLCDRVALMNKGRIVDVGSPRELLKKYGAVDLEEAFIKVVGGVR